MKKNQFIISVMFVLLALTACDKHDSLDDDVIVGNMAPQVYWEIGSSTVAAGSNVPFTVQYYINAKTEIDHLEVWYNVLEDESSTVSCPWTESFTYSISSSKSVEKRILQKISEYAHNPSCWSDSLHAFTFKSTFPTSNTLSTLSWIKPGAYESDKMTKYFGNKFMVNFKDSLYSLMKVSDFQKMYKGLGLVDNFGPYLDTIPADQSKSGTIEYVFNKDASGNRTVPQALVDMYKAIPFSDLIYNSSTNTYNVEFTRSYRIKAIVKTIDKAGTVGLSLSQEISLN